MDVTLYTYADPAGARADRAALLRSNEVRAVSTVEVFTVDVDGQSTPAISINPLARGLERPIVEGRLPLLRRMRSSRPCPSSARPGERWATRSCSRAPQAGREQ